MGNIEEYKLYEEGLEEYPAGEVIVGNVLMLLWIGAGTLAVYLLWPIIAWIFLGFSLLTIYVVLRKLVCTNCYYYGKRCSSGWGKLTAVMFSQGSIERFPEGMGLKIAPFIYGSLTVVPVAVLVFLMLKDFSWIQLLLLLFILGFGFYSGTITRRNSCSRCKMRIICPGSAVK